MHVLLPYRHYELVLTSYKLREVFTKTSLPAPFRAGHGQRECTTSFPFTDAVAVIGSGEPAASELSVEPLTRLLYRSKSLIPC